METLLTTISFSKTWSLWEAETCHKFQKFNFFSRTTKCNSQRRKDQKVAAIRWPTFLQSKLLMILFRRVALEQETKAKAKSKTVIRKQITTDMLLWVVKETQLSTLWIRYSTTKIFKTITVPTLSFPPTAPATSVSTPLRAISSREQSRTDRG